MWAGTKAVWLLPNPVHILIALFEQHKFGELLKQAQNLRHIHARNLKLLDLASASAQAINDLALCDSYCQQMLSVAPTYLPNYVDLGNVFRLHGRLADAENFYQRVAERDPRSAGNYLRQGNFFYHLKNYKTAERSYRQALSVKADFYEVWNNLGVVLKAQGKIEDARECYARSLEIRPDHVPSRNHLGKIYLDLGKLVEARECFEECVKSSPNFVPALYNLASLAVLESQTEEAEHYFSAVLRLDSSHVQAMHGLANTYRLLGRFEEAEHLYLSVIESKPDLPVPYLELSSLYIDLGRMEDAEEVLKSLVFSSPDLAEGHFRFAKMLAARECYEEADTHYLEAIRLAPVMTEPRALYGLSLQAQGRFDEAEAMYLSAKSFAPLSTEISTNLSNLYALRDKAFGTKVPSQAVVENDPTHSKVVQQSLPSSLAPFTHSTDAEVQYRRTIHVAPNGPNATTNLAHLLLAQGRFSEGWSLYEKRHELNDDFLADCNFDQQIPAWRGQPLTGKSILVQVDGETAEAIQFLRYLSLLRKGGATHITLLCDDHLLPLLQAFSGADEIKTKSHASTLPPPDLWCFLVSLPFLCQTTLETTPDTCDYLNVPPDYKKKWQNKGWPGGVKVGLLWDMQDPGTSNPVSNSLDQRALGPLWEAKNVHFVNLHLPEPEAAIRALPLQPLMDIGDQIDGILDIAALVARLDLIITVDSYVAHLAGALSRPVWLLLPYEADWRWLQERDDSPWYPTMRLFRQPHPGDWATVIEEVKFELKRRAFQKATGFGARPFLFANSKGRS